MAQAYVTVRKGNKKLAIYDLTLVLSWAGRWEIDGKEVMPAVHYRDGQSVRVGAKSHC